MLPATLTSLVVFLCTWFASRLYLSDGAGLRAQFPSQFPARPSVRTQPKLQLELRQLHAVSRDAKVLFHTLKKDEYRIWAQKQRDNVNLTSSSSDTVSTPDSSTTSPETRFGDLSNSYTLSTRPVKTYRPSSFAAHAAARLQSLRHAQSLPLQWEEEEVPGPDVESRETLLLLAKMANNAYVDPTDPYWMPLDETWNNTYPFGWEPDADGFRGQVFATPDNSTVVVSIKGTSAGLFGGGGPTAKKDKLNDNLLFSCCCARIDWSWTTVCGCYRGGGKCDQDCLENSLVEESLFYPIGTNLYNNLTYMYPTSNIWVIGHSLGGALASLLGATFGSPVVTFESPGERLASHRLHLPQPPSTHHVTHVYHTADPIAMGTCNGVLSSCALGGYALETSCHLGKTIVYDTVTHSNWAVDIRTHGIIPVIEKILSQPWQPSVDEGREVPMAKEQVDCVECYSWEFGDFPDPKKRVVEAIDG